ncbi:MAG: hypothetical protein ACLGI3_03525 [Actinomycetes bacterium]
MQARLLEADPGLLGVEAAIEPYNCEVAGETVLMTSLAVPIRVGEQVVGVAGARCAPLARVGADRAFEV